MKRIFDLIISLISILILIPIFIVVHFFIKKEDGGPSVYWSKRIGKNNKIFLMPKFRSMKLETPQVATHLLEDPSVYLTSVGKFIRKTSIDELPQFWSVLIGDMSLVGPRPALFNQDDLIGLRTKKNIHLLKPGITGWAQVNGRDELPIPQKVELDEFYAKNKSLIFDVKILFLTLVRVLKKDGVSH